ncbi:MAG: hypothetical protein PHP52_03405 [Bacteroidales bacterium]|nr:hypothetical protein [Bacteroidales bacterium]MDY0142867.1 hypothetical protein [Bacteroidales bacterium]
MAKLNNTNPEYKNHIIEKAETYAIAFKIQLNNDVNYVILKQNQNWNNTLEQSQKLTVLRTNNKNKIV